MEERRAAARPLDEDGGAVEDRAMVPAAIDVHTHAFPDALAARAVPRLAASAGITARLDGTVAALLGSMDRAGIALSVVCSIATEPRQFASILAWSEAIAGPRLLPFPSVHPGSPQVVEEVRSVARAGFRGVKLHPEYQDFAIDAPRLQPLYAALEEAGLTVLFHAGHDIGFPDSDRAAPARILAVHRAFPRLRIVASHLGGFRRWEEVAALLVGTGVWLDTSYTLGHIPDGLLRGILAAHRPDRILFGSDSPWVGQEEALAGIRALGLAPDLERRILSANARELLGLQG
jgi:predicted TIM-barrel fold metal-dependent hydrolase